MVGSKWEANSILVANVGLADAIGCPLGIRGLYICNTGELMVVCGGFKECPCA